MSNELAFWVALLVGSWFIGRTIGIIAFERGWSLWVGMVPAWMAGVLWCEFLKWVFYV